MTSSWTKLMINGQREKTYKGSLALAALLIVVGWASGRDKPSGPQFKYAGGTEKLQELCEGNLELGPTAVTFKCRSGSIAIPYASISLMQYRPDISRQVWKMKLKWKVRPAVEAPLMASKRNRYFTILYTGQGTTAEALVLAVAPTAMRPYLAELDLKSGKRVEVKSFEEYD